MIFLDFGASFIFGKRSPDPRKSIWTKLCPLIQESYDPWIFLKTSLCLVLDSQGTRKKNNLPVSSHDATSDVVAVVASEVDVVAVDVVEIVDVDVSVVLVVVVMVTSTSWKNQR